MASSAVQPLAVSGKTPALDTRLGKLLIPSLSDFFLVALIVWLFGVGEGWKGLVLDGDTGWHIRTGEYILQHAAAPQTDIFSYSKAGAPWFAWEWLTDVQYSLLHAQWGLGGVAVASGLLICASAYTLLRTMLWAGANVFISLVLTLLYVGASSLHHHARPHVWTLWLFALSTALLMRDRRKRTQLIWVLVPLVAIWTNLHGGFLAIIACVGLAAAGTFFESFPEWRGSLRYFGLTGACLAASLVNPYGFRLHIHVASYLQSSFIRDAVQEFQSPAFRSESMRQFELVLVLGIVCAGFLLARKRYVESLWILYFAHSALSSARHIPLYLIVASPIIAIEATSWWRKVFTVAPKDSVRGILDALSVDVARGFRRSTFWLAPGIALAVAMTAAQHWPSDFANTFPIQMVATQQERITGSRLFTSDQWGDYILYKLWPRQKVFVDGRSDFYGEKIGGEYLSLMGADYNWPGISKKYGFNLMLLPVKWPLASVLKLSPEWRVVADDGTAILFEPTDLHRAEKKGRLAGLLERNATAESTREAIRADGRH
jgi:hypothetical protein